MDLEVAVTRCSTRYRRNPRLPLLVGRTVIVVPVESQHPDVTIVRVFPTYQPNYDTHAVADPLSRTISTEVSHDAWPKKSNGG